jgi:hypothetical protein
MWNVKAKVTPVIVTGTISKSLRQYLSNIMGKQEIKEVQKNSHIVHCTQTAGSADVKVQNTFHGRNNITCSTDCKYRTAATLYTVEIWYIIVNTVHEGNNKDDDDDDDNNNATSTINVTESVKEL